VSLLRWGNVSRKQRQKGNGTPYLVCSKAKVGAGCKYHAVPYPPIEAALFAEKDEWLGNAPHDTTRGKKLTAELADLDSALHGAGDALENLLRTAGAARGGRPAVLVDRIRSVEAEIERLRARRTELAHQLGNAGPSVLKHRIKALRELLSAEAPETTADAVEAARMKRCTYLIIPKITHWEDRATEWSGIRDKMELFVKVIRVEDGVELRSAEIKGKSSWATFGGDHPQDLLKEPVAEFAVSLF